MRAVLFLPLICSLLIASCSNEDEENTLGRVPEITLEVVREFSEDPDNEDSWITSSGQVQVDSKGNIFLREYKRGLILKYNADGSFNRIIGSKGQGPGEYEDVTMFNLHSDSLYIFDRNSQRILIYDTEGENYRSAQLEENMGYPDLRATSYGFAAIQSLKFMSINDEPVGYAYDHDMKKLSDDKLMLSELYADYFDGDMISLANISPAEFVMLDDYKVLVAPSMYFGTIYELTLDPNTMTWSKTDSMSSGKIGELYKEVGANERGDYRISTTEGTQKFRIYNKSNAVMINDDGEILNFIYRDSGNQRIYGAEIFDMDYNYMGFDTLTVDPDLEDENRIYFIQPGDHRNGSYYRTLEKEDGSYVVQEFRLNIRYE